MQAQASSNNRLPMGQAAISHSHTSYEGEYGRTDEDPLSRCSPLTGQLLCWVVKSCHLMSPASGHVQCRCCACSASRCLELYSLSSSPYHLAHASAHVATRVKRSLCLLMRPGLRHAAVHGGR